MWSTGAWPSLGFTQTGHAGHLNLNRAAYDRLKAQIHHLSRNPALKTPATLAYLQGRLQWLAQLNPAKAARPQGPLRRPLVPRHWLKCGYQKNPTHCELYIKNDVTSCDISPSPPRIPIPVAQTPPFP